jgi:hypothetical protein
MQFGRFEDEIIVRGKNGVGGCGYGWGLVS